MVFLTHLNETELFIMEALPEITAGPGLITSSLQEFPYGEALEGSNDEPRVPKDTTGSSTKEEALGPLDGVMSVLVLQVLKILQ